MRLNKKITEELAAWLQSDHSSRESIIKGAELLFRMNNDRSMRGRIINRPERNLKFLEYKIGRFLKMQKDGKTLADVVRMDRELTADLTPAETSQPDDDGHLPVQQSETPVVYIRKGLRPDHDRLPEEIQTIWPKNAERWKKIKQLRETLKTLSEPCDRYEHLQILRELWYQYKKEMARYDDYRIDGSVPSPADEKVQLSEQQLRDLKNADSYISKNLPILLQLAEDSKEPDFASADKLESLRKRIQERVDVLVSLGRELSDERKQQLTACSIKFTADEQGT